MKYNLVTISSYKRQIIEIQTDFSIVSKGTRCIEFWDKELSIIKDTSSLYLVLLRI